MADENTGIIEEMTEAETEETADKVVKKVYIGPTILNSGLRTSQILEGTEDEINAFIEPQLERYPEVKYLTVDLNNLSEARAKVETKGNILHKYYQDMAAKAVASRRGG